MLVLGFNQQKLARISQVSDSEISRILSGKSCNPGVENALKLARAVGVSLDYLADDALDDEATPIETAAPAGRGSTEAPRDGAEAEVLDAARELGVRQARRVLETACDLGYEIAIRRLLEIRPLIEIGDSPRATVTPSGAPAALAGDRRASSA